MPLHRPNIGQSLLFGAPFTDIGALRHESSVWPQKVPSGPACTMPMSLPSLTSVSAG
jgi:hypothetical protein